MKPSTKRIILRIVHLVSVIPVLGYVYQARDRGRRVPTHQAIGGTIGFRKLITAMNMTLNGFCDHTSMEADDGSVI